MIYARDPTDWAGFGQFLLGVAAILALILQQFRAQKNRVKLEEVHEDVKKAERAVNNREEGAATLSDDVAEVRQVALDAKDSVAELLAQIPDLKRHLQKNVLKMDDIFGTVHNINAKQDKLGDLVNNHLAAHQAEDDRLMAREAVQDARDVAEDKRLQVELDTGEGG